MNPPPKRIRMANFSQHEKEVLFNLVYKYKSIIENKKTDGATWRDKEDAWSKVTDEFNSSCPNYTHRNMQSLKKVYDNEKRKTRKIAAMERQEQLKTGGGVPLAIPKSNELLLDIMNKKTINGLSNPFDTDQLQQVSSQNVSSEVLEIEDENIITLQGEDKENSLESTEPAKDWGNYKVSYLREPMDPGLSKTCSRNDTNNWNARRRPMANSLHSSEISKEYTKLAELKTELVNMQIEILKKESILKTELLTLEIEAKKLEILVMKKKLE